MDQRGDRGRALHGVRQPGVQAELRRFSHGADEQQDADDGERVTGDAEGLELRGGEVGRGGETWSKLTVPNSTQAPQMPSAKPTSHTRLRSEEHTPELQSLMRISYAAFCLKKNN